MYSKENEIQIFIKIANKLSIKYNTTYYIVISSDCGCLDITTIKKNKTVVYDTENKIIERKYL